ncbi:MAG: LamG-like jellyroll fold domain-containing protein, partial [Verrucomicrobiota bacterium]
MDSISEDWATTPDAATHNDFNLINIDPSALVDGHLGKALQFDGAAQYAYFTSPDGIDTGLPVSHKPQFSILYWVNGLGTGQNDRRMFSESSSVANDPLFNLGTHNTNNAVDIYIRDNGVKFNHAISTNGPLDGQWHHIAWVDDRGSAKLYIDGVLDSSYNYTQGRSPIDTTSLAAIVRSGVGNYFAGAIDEVSLWERALSAEEVQNVMTNGIQTPVPAFAPNITVQPSSSTNTEGNKLVISAAVTGAHPLSFQWYKNNQPVENGNTFELSFAELTPSDAGNYKLVISNSLNVITSFVANVIVDPLPAPNLTNGIIAYWPLDTVQGTKTPDVIHGYDMQLNNLTEADLVPGRIGNAFNLDSTRKTLLSRVHGASDELPANKHESYTIVMWTMIEGSSQNDLRVFSEANTGNSDPLFNIGTDNGGGQVADFYFRQTGWTTVDHAKSTGTPFDGQWHHIALVQNSGVRRFYIDGVADAIQLAEKEPGTWNVNDTTIGGILRASPSHWVTGLIDDVAIWDRALSSDEINKVVSEGIPVAPSNPLPLHVQSFTSEYPIVAKGDSVTLHWDVSKDASVSIAPLLGDVTAQTIAGSGSASVTITSNTTFTVTLTRGNESTNATITVAALENVAANWHLLETFQSYSPGPISNHGSWKNPAGENDILALGTNNVLGIQGGDDLAALELHALTLTQGNSGTLFFRLYAQPEDTNAVGINLGLTDKALRFVTDFTGDLGPYIRLERLAGETNISVLARNGVGSDYIPSDFVVQPGVVYDFWIDITNDIVEFGDIFTVNAKAEEESNRHLLFDQFYADRNPAGSTELGLPTPDLIYL